MITSAVTLIETAHCDRQAHTDCLVVFSGITTLPAVGKAVLR